MFLSGISSLLATSRCSPYAAQLSQNKIEALAAYVVEATR
jgi:hypothetical protein